MATEDPNSVFNSFTPVNETDAFSLPPTTAPIHDPNMSTLTDSQEVLMSSLNMISATLSCLGSSMIVYRVYKNRNETVVRKNSKHTEFITTPYDRIMLGLSVCDIVASLTFGFGSLLLPSDSSTRAWAAGTDTTCSFLGFFTVSILYAAMRESVCVCG
jgi:hypothetical protein